MNEGLNLCDILEIPRACLKNHSCNLHAPLCGIFYLRSVDVARYAALIQEKSPTNCDAHLVESLFQTRSRHDICFFSQYSILNGYWGENIKY